MSDERKYSEFVESMHRLYNGGMIQDKLLDNLFAGHKISKERVSVYHQEGGVICIPF